MIYIDHAQSPEDTVRIFIPSGKAVTKPANIDTAAARNIKQPDRAPADSASAAVEQPVSQMKTDVNQPVTRQEKDDVKNKDSVISQKTDEVKQPEDQPKDSAAVPANKKESTKQDDIVVLPKVVQSSSTNSDCKVFASNEDFLKLRKKMASENSDENMVKTAKKGFSYKMLQYRTNQRPFLFYFSQCRKIYVL